MKKILIFFTTLLITSCTSNERARNYGGKEEINLEKNHKLLSVTWKENNLWILTVDTTTNINYFKEKSSRGIIEGQIILHSVK